MFWSLLLIVFCLLLFYYYGISTYNYWKKRGVPFTAPKYPFLGSQFEIIMRKKSFVQRQIEIYNQFKGERFCGFFSFKKPVLMIRDPALVESVLIKDFTSFYNRGMTFVDDKELEPLSAHLVNLQDQQWKTLRQKLTPTFTSGKLKGMHQQLLDCADNLINYLNNYVDKSEPIEVREVMAKFSTDVIGSCAFGLNTNALNDPESQFRKMGSRVFQFTFWSILRFLFLTQFPKLLKILRWRAMPKEVSDFFINMIRTTISHREKNNLVRNDFVQLLMELRKQELEKNGNNHNGNELIIDDYVITSNAFVFFVAGFETTASTLGYCLYELSLHEDVQEQAYENIVSVLKKHAGEATYDAINEMKFINQIISETLRIHPPASELRRIVTTKSYIVPETNLELPKGCNVLIPVHSLHNDPENFPEPEKFKPERFDKEKNTIKKGTYVPFGDGPRVCIAKRFAKMELQVALVKMILKYKFKLNPKTISPLVYSPSSFLLTPVGGIWVDVENRT